MVEQFPASARMLGTLRTFDRDLASVADTIRSVASGAGTTGMTGPVAELGRLARQFERFADRFHRSPDGGHESMLAARDSVAGAGLALQVGPDLPQAGRLIAGAKFHLGGAREAVEAAKIDTRDWGLTWFEGGVAPRSPRRAFDRVGHAVDIEAPGSQRRFVLDRAGVALATDPVHAPSVLEARKLALRMSVEQPERSIAILAGHEGIGVTRLGVAGHGDLVKIGATEAQAVALTQGSGLHPSRLRDLEGDVWGVVHDGTTYPVNAAAWAWKRS